MHRRGITGIIAFILCLLCLGCQMAPVQAAVVVMDIVTPTPTPQTLHIATLQETPVPSAVPMPTQTPVPTPTLTPSPAPTPTPTDTPEATSELRSAKATATPKATARATATPKPTSRATAVPDEVNDVIGPPLLAAGAPAATATPKPVASNTGVVIVPDGYSVPSGAAYSSEEVVLAAKTAYFEARGKGEAAYRAVICVILNRAESTKFGGKVTSIKTEVYRKSQFSVVKRSDFETVVPPDEIIGYANDILNNGNRSIPEDVFFFRAGRTDKTWGTKAFYENIGGNDFYYGG